MYRKVYIPAYAMLNCHWYTCVYIWQLGLAEKSLLNYDFDPLSDPSDANTNSTTLISDEADDKSHRNTNPDMGMSAHLDGEVSVIQEIQKCYSPRYIEPKPAPH